MAQSLEQRRSINQETQPEVAKRTLVKKSYVPPQLLEYGSVAKLTQTASGPAGDIAGMMQPCL